MSTPLITFTLDVEDHGKPGDSARAPAVTRRLLESLATLQVRGTFFLVGTLASEHRDLVRDIAAGGHEVALHAWDHEPLPGLDPSQFRAGAARGKALLEDLTGNAVHGFRAPTFSLVPSSHWAIDVIGELGFTYSSSVLPARSPLFGDPAQPRHPYRWPNGLLELPCPVTTFGRIANPYLGGVYFRVLPWPMVRFGLSQAAGDELLWLYCHPYDFDPDEPFSPRSELGRVGSRLMWLNRRHMLRRVERILEGRVGPPLAERAAALGI